MDYAKKIVGKVKQHYWIDEHLVLMEPQKYVVGRFFKDSGDIEIWNNAINGDVGVDFQRLLIHEYIESNLMNAGLPFRGLNSDVTSAYNYGAHDLSPLTSNSTMTWSNLQRNNPNKAVNLTNLDELVSFIKQIEGF